MKKPKLWIIMCAVFFGVQLIAEITALVTILKLDILPDMYTVLLVCVFAAGLLLTGALMFWPPRKPDGGKVRRVIAWVLAVIIAVLCIIACSVVGELYQTMHAITTTPDSAVTRQVYVLQDDPAQTLEDAADYTFGIVADYDKEATQAAIDTIEDTLGRSITVVSYPTIPELVDALYSGQCGAILLNSGNIAILEEEEAYADFSERTRILTDVRIELTSDPVEETTKPAETDTTVSSPTQPAEPDGVTNTPFIMYISGSDTRSKYLSTSRSDVNILAVVNPETKQVLLLNTPRDYYIPNPVGNGQLDKLTHCGIYGIDCSIQALSDLYGIDIDYYAQINFTGFETLVDAVGGVTVNSSAGFTSEGVTIVKGENNLDGKAALVFARERYQLAGGDNARGQNQMKVIKAIISKLTTSTTLISNYSQILDSLEGMFVTSMEMSDISKLVKMQLSDMAQWNVQSFAVTGNTGRDITYSMPGQKLSVMYQNEALVEYAGELISRVMAGQILTEEDMTLPS